MQNPIQQHEMHTDSGSSLLEVMVVIAILGIMSASVIFGSGLIQSLGQSERRSDADRFYAAVHAQAEAAINTSQPRALVLDSFGYQSARRIDRKWELVEPKISWRCAEIDLGLQGRDTPLRMVFWPSGQVSTASIGFCDGAVPTTCDVTAIGLTDCRTGTL